MAIAIVRDDLLGHAADNVPTMMNYVAIQIVSYFCMYWENPKGSGKIGVINSNTMDGWLPVSYTHLDVYKRQAGNR